MTKPTDAIRSMLEYNIECYMEYLYSCSSKRSNIILLENQLSNLFELHELLYIRIDSIIDKVSKLNELQQIELMGPLANECGSAHITGDKESDDAEAEKLKKNPEVELLNSDEDSLDEKAGDAMDNAGIDSVRSMYRGVAAGMAAKVLGANKLGAKAAKGALSNSSKVGLAVAGASMVSLLAAQRKKRIEQAQKDRMKNKIKSVNYKMKDRIKDKIKLQKARNKLNKLSLHETENYFESHQKAKDKVRNFVSGLGVGAGVSLGYKTYKGQVKKIPHKSANSIVIALVIASVALYSFIIRKKIKLRSDLNKYNEAKENNNKLTMAKYRPGIIKAKQEILHAKKELDKKLDKMTPADRKQYIAKRAELFDHYNKWLKMKA